MAVNSYFGGTIVLYFGNSGTQKITGQANGGNVVNADTLGRVVFQGGAANTFPVITGKVGLCASAGGVIAYANVKNDATTKTSASSGGRIYAGAQTSVPNY
jgi:hypothetical protein